MPTGEILGTGTGNDGNVDGILAISMGSANLANANFGLDQLPNSNNASATYTNPGGTNHVIVPSLTGYDPEDGPLGYGNTLVITQLPENGFLFYNNIPVILNQVISNYNSSFLTLDPDNGSLVVVFGFAFVDAASQQDPTPAIATLTFNDLTISGTVYDDGNGMNNNYVDGTGTNGAGNIHVNLVSSSSGLVVASSLPGTDGFYVFGTADGVLNITGYNLVLTNAAQVPGSSLVAASFPANWVPTGEKHGTGPGNDGTIDGILAVSTNQGIVSDAFFGLDQLPESDDITGTHLNPGGTEVFQVPTLSGSDAEDGLLGPGDSFIINSLAVNGTLYYNDIPVTTGQVVTNYAPELLTLDPDDGTPVITFTYISIDAAGFQDPTPAAITITMTLIPYADVSVQKSDSSERFTAGTYNVYYVIVKNAWNDEAPGTAVTDTTPSGTLMSWTASFSAGATGNSSGTGDIRETVDIPPGGTVTYTVTVSVPCNYPGDLVNSAYVRGPSGITDPDTTNNSATDIDTQNAWTGSVSDNWNDPSNWTIGIPDAANGNGAWIPGGLPIYPVIYDTAMSAATLIISNGASLAIEAGKDLYVSGCTTINGPDALYLGSDKMNGNASFITSPEGYIIYPGDGSAKADLFLGKCAYSGDCSYYVSSPLSDALTGVFAGDSLRSYDEQAGSFGPFITSTTDPLQVMAGYMLSNSADETRTFQGKLNDSTLTRPMTLTTGKGNGWNLAGNPYPSWIDLSTPLDWTDLDLVVYPYDHLSGNYKPYPISVGFGLGGQYIPSMAGFFVHVNSDKTSGTLRFRDENRIAARKQASGIELPENLLWLKAEGNGDMYDEAIVYFRNDANTGYDQDIDCFKLEGASAAPQLSSISSDDISLAINALPFDSLDQNIIVPLEFYVPSQESGAYTLKVNRTESFTSGTNIWLEDRKIDTMIYLNDHPDYDFNYSGGDDPARFYIHFYYPHYGIGEKSNTGKIQIYSWQNTVYVKDLAGREMKGVIRVYNILGQKVAQRPLTGGAINKFNLSLPEGYYIAEVNDDGKVTRSKLYLTR